MRGDYPLSRICRNLGLARSSCYQKRAAKRGDDKALRATIWQLAHENAYQDYGSRRMTAQLRRAPHQLRVGRHRVRRLMAEMGLLQKTRPAAQHHQQPAWAGHLSQPGQRRQGAATGHIWVADITHIALPGKTAYLAHRQGCLHAQDMRLALERQPGASLDPERFE